jgi:crossover junction endodeoxyribonuclease RuvC
LNQQDGQEIRILGIDPGSIKCGYGLIKTFDRHQPLEKGRSGMKPTTLHLDTPDFLYITAGRITLSPKSPLHLRLRSLHETLIDIIKRYNPHEVVVERMFFAKNIRAALNLGHARGIALLAAASEGLTLYEYSALEVKKAITGYGRADKRQVLAMVKRMLNINDRTVTLTEDSADALALALCHVNTSGFKKSIKNLT